MLGRVIPDNEFTIDWMYQQDMDIAYHHLQKMKRAKTMNREKLLEFAEELFEAAKHNLSSKGDSYSSKEDVLQNFARNATNLGLEPSQVWAIYFNKHIDSINNAIKHNPDKPVDNSEGLVSRIEDAIAYLVLFRGMIETN